MLLEAGADKGPPRRACLTGTRETLPPAHPGKGRRPCHSARLTPDPPGAIAPGQRPPRPRRALLARRVGRWPLSVQAARVFVAAFRAGGGNAMRFLLPPGEGAEDQTPNHQPRCNGRGYRPCHSARLTLGQPGAQSPRPAPAPPMAGASRPPGRALASVGAGSTGPGGSVAGGRGKRSAFPGPARIGETVRMRTASAVAMAGAIAPATAPD
jgi:hypothetical protein